MFSRPTSMPTFWSSITSTCSTRAELMWHVSTVYLVVLRIVMFTAPSNTIRRYSTSCIVSISIAILPLCIVRVHRARRQNLSQWKLAAAAVSTNRCWMWCSLCVVLVSKPVFVAHFLQHSYRSLIAETIYNISNQPHNECRMYPCFLNLGSNNQSLFPLFSCNTHCGLYVIFTCGVWRQYG